MRGETAVSAEPEHVAAPHLLEHGPHGELAHAREGAIDVPALEEGSAIAATLLCPSREWLGRKVRVDEELSHDHTTSPHSFGLRRANHRARGDRRRRLDGKTAIVTGGYAGIGLETTRVLAAAGATVIVPARDARKASAALAGVASVELEALDLAEPAHDRRVRGAVLARADRCTPRSTTPGSWRRRCRATRAGSSRSSRPITSGTSSSPRGCWPALRAREGARVVALSSRGHVRGRVDFEDPKFEHRPYDKWVAYGQSKTANMLFAVALDGRGDAHGVRAFAVHPGAILDTDLGRSMPGGAAGRRRAARKVPAASRRSNRARRRASGARRARSSTGSAACTARTATSPRRSPGSGGPKGVRPWAIDPEIAQRLWTQSEGWTGASLP